MVTFRIERWDGYGAWQAMSTEDMPNLAGEFSTRSEASHALARQEFDTEELGNRYRVVKLEATTLDLWEVAESTAARAVRVRSH